MQKVKSLFIALLLSATVQAQSSTGEQPAVQQTIEKMFTTLTNADTAQLKLYCTADVKFYEYGQIWTIDTLIHKVMQSKSIPDFKRINSFEFVNISIRQKTAWVTYYLQSTFTRNGKKELIKWMETVVLLKEKKNWKVTVLHSTRLPGN